MLERVISGGQTGVDQAGLRAARRVGIATGGWLPKGCITLDGPREDLLGTYGMVECAGGGYPARTRANVRDSDATLRIARNFRTPGERCTLTAITALGKPYLDIPANKFPLPDEVYRWLGDHYVTMVNIAGNSEQSCPGIGYAAYKFLLRVFSIAVLGRK